MAAEQKRKLAVGVPALVAVALLCVAFIMSVEPRPGKAVIQRRKAVAQITIIGMALAEYRSELGCYPPDTGHGLNPVKSPETYGAGSLWRYLTQPVIDPTTGQKIGPFLEEWPKEYMAPYDDPKLGPSFSLTDPWGNPFGFVGERKRVVHNPGCFDILSRGPDEKTASDEPGAEPNLAYDGLDNDGDGMTDDAGELGAAARNGADEDDINNW